MTALHPGSTLLACGAMKNIWQTLRDLLPLFPAKARHFFVWYIVIRVRSLTMLDVAAMALLALVISPAVTNSPIHLPFVGPLPVTATPWLVALACALIVFKSMLSVLLHWIATRRFARVEF